jgi:hypothetical protein
MTTNCHPADFLTANGINTWADLPAGPWAPDADTDVIADVMLANWTFDGALVPDRGELEDALVVMRAVTATSDADRFRSNAAELIARSTGDVWTALDNARAWPADETTGLLTFPDGSTMTEAEAIELDAR